MKQKIESGAVKRFILVFLGSLFLQIFCWAMYSYLELNIWFCGLSVIITALLYHFLQVEEETGLSRRCVFFAAILLPFLLGAGITVIQLVKYPQLNLLSASLDGVSPMTELISLYATRLAINGVLLLIFAAIDRSYRENHPPKAHTRREQNET